MRNPFIPLSQNPTVTWIHCKRLTPRKPLIPEVIMKLKDKLLWFWHPILGALIPLFGLIHVAYGILWFLGFVIYEITEAKTVKDEPCWDIRDFLIGFGVAMVGLIIWRLAC